MFGQLRKDTADPSARLPMATERKGIAKHVARNGRDRLDAFAGVRTKRAAMVAFEEGLVIERVHLRHAAIHEKLNHAPCAGGMMDAVAVGRFTACEQALLS